MKCKQHPLERGPGVCAPCLRDRLLAILLEEAHSASASAICSPSPSLSAAAAASSSARVVQGHRRQHRYARADSLPSAEHPPLAFPRSVSPYISHRRSVDCGTVGSPLDHRRGRGCARSALFYSTPQVGPAAAGGVGTGRGRSKKRWSVLSALVIFGRRSGTNRRSGDPRSETDTCSDPPTSASKTEKHGSWLSWFGRSKSKKVGNTSGAGSQYSFTDAPSGCGGVGGGGPRSTTKPQQQRYRCRHPRGMSPDTSVSATDDADEHHWHDPTSSQHHSEYSTTTDFSSPSPAWRIPGPTPLRKTPGAGRHMSGFAVCLSPLVWASPGERQRNGQVAIDAGCSGELKPGRRGGGGSSGCPSRHRHHGSDGGAVLGPNRSRKLADLGTFR